MQQKRERERQRRPIHIRRIHAELRTVAGLGQPALVQEIRLLLNDLSPKGIGVAGNQKLDIGQAVAITIEQPKRFYVRGRIVWCREMETSGKIISTNPFNFKMGIEFVYDSPEEEKAVAEFCDAVANDVIFNAKPEF